jgi:hypothetical protein
MVLGTELELSNDAKRGSQPGDGIALDANQHLRIARQNDDS